jgi:hypothetical protein
VQSDGSEVVQSRRLTDYSLIFEIALEHPERLFVPLEPLDHQILRLQIACSACFIPCAHRIVDNFFMRNDQRGFLQLRYVGTNVTLTERSQSLCSAAV